MAAAFRSLHGTHSSRWATEAPPNFDITFDWRHQTCCILFYFFIADEVRWQMAVLYSALRDVLCDGFRLRLELTCACRGRRQIQTGWGQRKELRWLLPQSCCLCRGWMSRSLWLQGLGTQTQKIPHLHEYTHINTPLCMRNASVIHSERLTTASHVYSVWILICFTLSWQKHSFNLTLLVFPLCPTFGMFHRKMKSILWCSALVLMWETDTPCLVRWNLPKSLLWICPW